MLNMPIVLYKEMDPHFNPSATPAASIHHKGLIPRASGCLHKDHCYNFLFCPGEKNPLGNIVKSIDCSLQKKKSISSRTEIMTWYHEACALQVLETEFKCWHLMVPWNGQGLPWKMPTLPGVTLEHLSTLPAHLGWFLTPQGSKIFSSSSSIINPSHSVAY